jgi:hypothetical protein
MTLHFFAGHEDDDAPNTNEILVLLERTESYIRNILNEDYSDVLLSLQVDDIDHVYTVRPKQKFEFSFVANISMDEVAAAAAGAEVRPREMAQKLVDNDSVEEFVGQYAPFADDGASRNGLFGYTRLARARITGSGRGGTIA